MNRAVSAGLAAAIAASRADIQFKPGALPRVVSILDGLADHYISETVPYVVTAEMRNLLANGNDPKAQELRQYFIIKNNHQPEEPITA